MTHDANARIVEEALRWVGTPYRHQGMRLGVGCDCLGLVRGVWRAVYGRTTETPGPYAPDWAETGAHGDRLLDAARRHCREKRDEPRQAGDLVLFRWKEGLAAKHCGILLDRDRLIHAYEGHAVTISPLVPQWRRRIAGVFTFPPLP